MPLFAMPRSYQDDCTGHTRHTACCMSCKVLHLLLLLLLALAHSSGCVQQEFAEIHSNAAHLQLESFYIGKLAQQPLTQQASACMPSRCMKTCYAPCGH